METQLVVEKILTSPDRIVVIPVDESPRLVRKRARSALNIRGYWNVVLATVDNELVAKKEVTMSTPIDKIVTDALKYGSDPVEALIDYLREKDSKITRAEAQVLVDWIKNRMNEGFTFAGEGVA